MLNPSAPSKVLHSSFSSQLLLLNPYNSFFPSHGRKSLSFQLPGSRNDLTCISESSKGGGAAGVHRICRRSTTVKTSVASPENTIQTSLRVKAVAKAQLGQEGLLSELSLTGAFDAITNAITDFVGKSLTLELISSELDPDTGSEKERIKGYGHKVGKKGDEVEFECTFDVPRDFGEVGAIMVVNELRTEMLLQEVILEGLSDNAPLIITCNSWVESKFVNPEKRFFFTNKCYLPSQTPAGLKKIRVEELKNLRGNGTGERKSSDRIYDYDRYNDLGNPDESEELARPVLGGPQYPYPRRCRTGRPPTKADPLSEQRSTNVYVPRDEQFSAVKSEQFSGTTLRQVLHAVIPSLETALINSNLGFPNFRAIDNLFNEGITFPKFKDQNFLQTLLPRLFKALTEGPDNLLLFETPEMINRDYFSWLKDAELSRQTLAGLNPYSIQLVTEWPLKSTLDPKIYGPPESAITTELIERQIKGIMTVDEALKQKKLFLIDYYDLLLPFVQKVRALEGTTLYGSRTLFFLTPEGTLKPIAIELVRPPMDGKPFWRNVNTPGFDATSCWLWNFAKLHVCAHDSGYHELVSHWLRTHACMEPYIIATNRQLSAMHPIYRLLHPHLRYTMEINALAREALINAGGIIEISFSPGKYSMELSSAAYEQLWRFDKEALPADLIKRGMAVEDPTAKHGLKLTIEDYPFANDGLLVWDAITSWVTDYVNHYYPQSNLILTDSELQEWWTEIRTRGHEDKKDEPWWPSLNTPDDLIKIITTMVWVASCHHAAVNFGQYMYGGYFPNRPSIARITMPNEDPSEQKFNKFMLKPDSLLLECLPSQIQATIVMAILDVLSTHSSDEEYLGDHIEPSWSTDPIIKAAFERFNGRMIEIEGMIDARNKDLNLRNRAGVGIVPYELLKPFSKPGVTGKGIPTSVSI